MQDLCRRATNPAKRLEIHWELRQGLDALPEGDKEVLVDFGVEFAVRQCRELLKAGVPGLHVYTMDRSKSTVKIVEKLRKEELL